MRKIDQSSEKVVNVALRGTKARRMSSSQGSSSLTNSRDSSRHWRNLQQQKTQRSRFLPQKQRFISRHKIYLKSCSRMAILG